MSTKAKCPIQLNNIAAQLLEEGDFHSSDLLFKEALKLLIPQLKTTEDTVHAGFKRELRSSAKFSWCEAASLPEGGVSSDIGSSGIYLFSRAIHIQPPLRKTTSPSRECKAAMLFNAGLSAHLIAMSDPKAPVSGTLRRAKLLYSLSRTVLKSFRYSALFYKLSIHMAIVNNLGHLSYELADFECCKRCFEFLRQCIVACQKHDPLGEYGKLDQRGFIENAMFAIPTCAPCA